MEKEFLLRIEQQEKVIKNESKTSGVLGSVKLALFALIVASLICVFFRDLRIIFGIIGVLSLIAFIVFCVWHSKVQKRIKYAKGVVAVCQRHLARISGKWTEFSDTGAEFINSAHPYANDLDIFGKSSLFQFLNTSYSWHGRKAFAADLSGPDYNKEEIKKRQAAVTELSKDIDFTNDAEYHLSKLSADKSATKLTADLKNKQTFINSKALKIVLTYLPIPVLAVLICMIIFQQTYLYITGCLLIALQLCVWLAGAAKANKYLAALSYLPYKLHDYGDIFEAISTKSFTSPKLIEIQSRLSSADTSAANAIKALARISSRVSYRNNGIMLFLLNALLLWDYGCALSFEKWKAKYADFAEDWFLALGEFESLQCFSHLPNVCTNTCLPEVSGHKSVVAQSLGHPLIKNEVRICNDVSLKDNIFIISGSNMSGKTTFLRTAGINMVLGRAGSYVCAKAMSFAMLRIITSMRITDDLNEGISTFYAELKRIKSIIELAKTESGVLFLIDEIFRGTNSIDRLSGTKTVLAKLNDLGTVGMITTHDLDVCELSGQYPRIKNYSFNEYYTNDRICFDYKLQSGQSQTTNAKYLMRLVGIM